MDRRVPRGPGGWSLVELALALSTGAVPAFAAGSLLSDAFSPPPADRESSLAMASMTRTLETMQGGNVRFEDLFRAYNADPSDDPGGPGTGPGASFAVAGLEPRAGDADRAPGRIEFPSPEGSPELLREDLTAELFGLAVDHDLDGDGVVDDSNHAGNYLLLPVLVRVEWTGPSGEESRSLHTFPAKR
ncbi:MAG TPA: hypothetical protein VKF62_00590 [Planctomycetota bacterium]|nr:hypothetical protein [Planctomycetota bacterium]